MTYRVLNRLLTEMALAAIRRDPDRVIATGDASRLLFRLHTEPGPRRSMLAADCQAVSDGLDYDYG